MILKIVCRAKEQTIPVVFGLIKDSSKQQLVHRAATKRQEGSRGQVYIITSSSREGGKKKKKNEAARRCGVRRSHCDGRWPDISKSYTSSSFS